MLKKESTFHIVLVPQSDHRNLLNDLQNDFYLGGFRYTTKPRYSDVHITLNQLKIDDKKINFRLEKEVGKLLEGCEPFPLYYYTITKEIKSGDDHLVLKKKYPKGWGRVSLLFKNTDNELGVLAGKSIKIADDMGIDDTQGYVDTIKTFKAEGEQSENLLDYTANHLNICNYCLPNKTQEAYEITKKTIPKYIMFDTIALRDFYGNHIFEISF